MQPFLKRFTCLFSDPVCKASLISNDDKWHFNFSKCETVFSLNSQIKLKRTFHERVSMSTAVRFSIKVLEVNVAKIYHHVSLARINVKPTVLFSG